MNGRFAPSPTSDLHLGNLRTAVLSSRAALSAGLGHLIRIEDLDSPRASSAVAAQQLTDLADLGVISTGPVVRQSERSQWYREAVAQLDTYPCFCSRKDIAEAAVAPHDGLRAYPGTCSRLSSAQQHQRALVRPAALRVRAEGAQQRIVDTYAGELTATVDDFVVVRNDGIYAYNLAVVVDDGLQQIRQVTRGRDLVDSSPRQAWLATRLGFEVPSWNHVGLAITTDGRRLAKRDQAVTIGQLTAQFEGSREAAISRAWQLIEPTLADPGADWVVDLGAPSALG